MEGRKLYKGEIEESSLEKALLSEHRSVTIDVESKERSRIPGKKPPGLVVTEDEGTTPLVSPSSLGSFQQGGWLASAAGVSLLYALFMFAAILSCTYKETTLAPWCFVGAATCAILSSSLVFTAALSLHQQRLKHHQANSHRYQRMSQSSHPLNGTHNPADSSKTPPRLVNSGLLNLNPNLAPTSLKPTRTTSPLKMDPTSSASRAILYKALPHLQVENSNLSTPGGHETPGRNTPSRLWNLAIGVDPEQAKPVSLSMVLCATASLAASAFTTLVALTIAETSREGARLPLYLGATGLLCFLLSLGLITCVVVRRGCSPDGTYAALWLVVDAPPHLASRSGTGAQPTPRTPKTQTLPANTTQIKPAGEVVVNPGSKPTTPRPQPPSIERSPARTSPGSLQPTPQQVERAVARILRGTVKANIVVALGGLYLNLPLAVFPIVVSMFLIGPERLVESDQRPLVYGLLVPLLFLVSALDFATFFFFVPRSVSAIWLALKHPRIASSHVRSGRGAMMLSSVVLLMPFVQFYFCVAGVAVYFSAEGGSIGFGHLLITPWDCVGIFSAGAFVVVLTSLICIASLKVRLSQWMEPHKLSSRTTKGVVYASLLAVIVVGIVTFLFRSLRGRSLCLLAFLAFVPIIRSYRQAGQARA